MDYTRFLASSREDKYPNHFQFSLPNLQTRLEQATLFEKLKMNFNADFIEPSAFLNLSHQEDNTLRNPDDFLLPDSHVQVQLSPMDDYAKHYFQAFRSQEPNLFQPDGIKDGQDYLGSMDIDFWGSNEDPQAMQTDSEMTKNMECSNSVSANSQSDAPLQIPSLIIPALETHSPIKDRNRLRANSMLSESTIACDNILCQSPVELCNQRRKSQTTQSKSKKKKELEGSNGNQNSTGMSPPYLKLKKSKSEFDSSIFPSNAGINMLSYYAELRCSQGNEMLYNNPFVSYTPNYFDRSAEKDERNENSTDISSCISTHPQLEDPNNLMNNTYPTTLPFLNQTQSTYAASYDMGERLSFPPDNMDFFSNSTPLIRTHGPVIKKIGPLTVEERQAKIDKYLQKRKQRSWNKKISYDCRKRVADGRLRIRGRFVTKSHAFAILEADGVAYDPNKITMAEIKEYLTKKFMDHPHIDEHEKLKQFEDEYFKFERKEEDGEGELYYDLNEEFGMSPLGSDDGKCGFPYN